ncbi:MAG: DUF512 domain-containing protein [Chloroflexi bacterium]|nr:DUF512 domain-containing protein [Chloroflexota bacterium]MCL5074705.1 DUF512 domain-containing protein [Chloroflexota bacterium]
MQVEPESEAARLGIRRGDRLLAVNGKLLRDVLDYQFYTADEALHLTIERREQCWQLKAAGGQPLGISFAEPTFDGLRRCQNHCPFCFIDQLPKGLRPSLYIKDDDFRYSFLYGHFITLTNLSEDDWQRLAEQRLSPLYVSVHATDLELRRQLLGNPAAPDILEQLVRLGQMGIRMHTQVVICPGVNDDLRLKKTVFDLAVLYPWVQSIGLVPVGLTRQRRGRSSNLRLFTAAEAAQLVPLVHSWQKELRARLGVGLVYLADELYLLAGCPIPAAWRYDKFPQYSNGIGMVRVLLDEWSRIRKRNLGRISLCKATIVCGRLIQPVLAAILAELSTRMGVHPSLLPVENHFFGESITVSGLLTAPDILATARGQPLGDLVILPEATIDPAIGCFLDGMTPAELEQQLGIPLRFAGTVRGLLGATRMGQEALKEV